MYLQFGRTAKWYTHPEVFQFACGAFLKELAGFSRYTRSCVWFAP